MKKIMKVLTSLILVIGLSVVLVGCEGGTGGSAGMGKKSDLTAN